MCVYTRVRLGDPQADKHASKASKRAYTDLEAAVGEDQIVELLHPGQLRVGPVALAEHAVRLLHDAGHVLRVLRQLVERPGEHGGGRLVAREDEGLDLCLEEGVGGGLVLVKSLGDPSTAVYNTYTKSVPASYTQIPVYASIHHTDITTHLVPQLPDGGGPPLLLPHPA